MATGTAALRATASRLLPALPVALSLFVHGHVLGHYFFFDEFLHLYNLANFGAAELLLTPHGGHLLVTSHAVFYGLHRLFGLETAGYFAAALAAHAINVWLLFRAIELFTGSRRRALLGAALWGMSPVGQGALGWYAVFGHVLVASFLLLVLVDAARARRAGAPLTRGRLALWILLLFAAATSFGMGIAVAVVFGAAAWWLFADVPGRRRVALATAPLAVAIPLLYLGLHGLHARWSGRSPLHGVSSLLDPLRAQLPVEWHALLPLLFDFVGYGVSSLALGGLLAAEHTGVAAGPLAGMSLEGILCVSRIGGATFLLLLLWGLARGPARRRRELLALGLLAAACYGSVALWSVASGRGPSMRLANLPLESLAVAPRYHYAGPLLLCLLLCLLPGDAPRLGPRAGRRAGIALAALLAVLLALDLPASRALARPGARAEHERAFARIRREVRDHPVGADVYIRNRPFRLKVGALHDERFPGWAALFVITHPSEVLEGRRVYFVEEDAELLAAVRAREGTRMARLLVGPERLPRRPPEARGVE